MPNIVTACLFLHNLRIMEGDDFDMQWAKDAAIEMLSEANNCLWNMQNVNMFNIFGVVIERDEVITRKKFGDRRKRIY